MEYIVISLKHGTGKSPMFWRADNKGYTYSPFAAGKYTKETIDSDPGYYNNGVSTIAVPLTDQAMELIGFSCKYVGKSLDEYYKNSTSRS